MFIRDSYKAEVKELMAKFQSEGMNEEEAKAKAEAESTLMKEAREMLVKWEANDPEAVSYTHLKRRRDRTHTPV